MEPLNIPGLANGYKVDDKVWRSAQPPDSAWPELAAAGLKSVVDLNTSGTAAITHQMDLILPLGMKYTPFSWNGVLPPSVSEIKTAIAAIEAAEGPVLVHCEHGSDRTGTLCACWRIHTGWTVEKAIEEALAALGLQGMHEVWMTLAIAEYAKSVGRC